MRSLAIFAFCLFEYSFAFQFEKATGESLKFSHERVFDWMKVLTNQEIYALISQKEVQWPTYDTIPPPSFACADKAFPGYYADPSTQCQTFHRCDVNGNLTSYICVNRTVFNPITLVCDQWFNVDCQGFIQDEYFANRRLYTNLPVFDDIGKGHHDPTGRWVFVEENGSTKSGSPATPRRTTKKALSSTTRARRSPRTTAPATKSG